MSEGHDWRHGWIPVTYSAALEKAHGSRPLAERLLSHTRRGQLRDFSDDELAAQLGDTEDDAEVDRIMAELERRDRLERKRAKDRDRRAAHRATRDAAREAEFDRALADGEDAEAAYARIYGLDETRMRRASAAAALRDAGYRGRGFDDRVRAAHREHAEQSYYHAETETRGHMLNQSARAAGVHPLSLFTGPEARARKHASEELLDYWQRHGRMTVDDFRASLLGGHMRHTGAVWL